jgi:hypothetical protein
MVADEAAALNPSSVLADMAAVLALLQEVPLPEIEQVSPAGVDIAPGAEPVRTSIVSVPPGPAVDNAPKFCNVQPVGIRICAQPLKPPLEHPDSEVLLPDENGAKNSRVPFGAASHFVPERVYTVAPFAPAEPADPVDPVDPVGPVGPVGPVRPVRPVGPVGPVGPVAPEDPCCASTAHGTPLPGV